MLTSNRFQPILFNINNETFVSDVIWIHLRTVKQTVETRISSVPRENERKSVLLRSAVYLDDIERRTSVPTIQFENEELTNDRNTIPRRTS